MQTKTLLLALFAAATAVASSIPVQARAAAAAEFGTCNPAMSFALGRPAAKPPKAPSSQWT
jgi:hypothetical protein